MTIDRLTAALADRYRIERELGQGGMATVYLAQDVKHDRMVAIKVLRPELAAVIGADRFLSEIKTTANLQHPHILPLFDSGQADSFLFYVMPFIDGESLRDRLSREKHLPIADAVRIATEIASALDYAHRHGIIHRDIKPENILLHDGRALVADFGIALAASTAGSRMTETGMSLGTPTYMSPEQAMGERTLDARTDVYALGCVTYEMLVGDPPFLGSTAQAIVAKVMTESPAPPSRSRNTIPEAVEDAVLTALAKLPADRFPTAAAFATALHGNAGTQHHTRSTRTGAAAGPWRKVSTVLGVLALVLMAVTAWALTQRGGSEGPLVFDAGLPDSAAMFFTGQTPATPYGSAMQNLSLANDGNTVVYLVQAGESTMLWRRSLRDAVAAPISGSDGGSMPRISPDGSQVAFIAAPGIMVVPLAGGPPRRIVETEGQVTGLEWTSTTQLIMTDAEGYRAQRLDVELASIESHPITRCVDGRWVAEEALLICGFGGVATLIDPETGVGTVVRTASTDGAATAPLAGSAFRVIAGKYLVYTAPEGDLRAAPYDRATHTAGRSVPMLDGIRRESVGTAQYDINAAGMLTYAPGNNAGVGDLYRLGPDGVASRLPVEPGTYARWDLSRDRRLLATVVQASGYQQLEIHDLQTGQSFVWLRNEGIGQPLWNPTGNTLLVRIQDSSGASLVLGSPFTPGPPDTLGHTSDGSHLPVPLDFHSSSRVLARAGNIGSLVVFDPTNRPVRFDTIPGADGGFVMMSPSGRHLLFSISEGSRVMVAPWPLSALQRQVAANSVEPLWLSDREVLYRSGVTWHVAPLDPVTAEPVGASRVWGSDPRFSDTFGWSNRPSWDGGIIIQRGPPGTSASYLRVIPNWVAQMKRAVDEANQ
jgi:tRNA A-37 threonylcarbamoyl transferase component Bud32